MLVQAMIENIFRNTCFIQFRIEDKNINNEATFQENGNKNPEVVGFIDFGIYKRKAAEEITTMQETQIPDALSHPHHCKSPQT